MSVRRRVGRDGKPDSWFYVLELPRRPDGRRHQATVGGFPTRKAAQDALDTARGALQKDEFVERSAETVGSFLDDWLKAVRIEIGETTAVNYETNIRAYVLPHLARVRLQELTPQRLQRYYVELLEHGRKDGGPLAPKTVSNVHRILSRACNDAVRWNLLSRNPVSAVRGPRIPRREQRTWSRDEAQWFLRTVDGTRLEALWILVLNTGMRRGEIAGLRWRDVNLDAGTVTIANQRTTANYRIIEKEPKASSIATIPVDATVAGGVPSATRRTNSWRPHRVSRALACKRASLGAV